MADATEWARRLRARTRGVADEAAVPLYLYGADWRELAALLESQHAEIARLSENLQIARDAVDAECDRAQKAEATVEQLLRQIRIERDARHPPLRSDPEREITERVGKAERKRLADRESGGLVD